MVVGVLVFGAAGRVVFYTIDVRRRGWFCRMSFRRFEVFRCIVSFYVLLVVGRWVSYLIF